MLTSTTSSQTPVRQLSPNESFEHSTALTETAKDVSQGLEEVAHYEWLKPE